MLRLSLHDPLMALNIESDSEGGVKTILQGLLPFLLRFDQLDAKKLAEFTA